MPVAKTPSPLEQIADASARVKALEAAVADLEEVVLAHGRTIGSLIYVCDELCRILPYSSPNERAGMVALLRQHWAAQTAESLALAST